MGEHTTDPLTLALIALAAVATVLQILVRRKANGNGNGHPKCGFTEQEAGQMKEKVANLEYDSRESEADRRRIWKEIDTLKARPRR